MEGKRLSDFKEVYGVSPEEALAVAKSDAWFKINKPKGTKRYIKIILDDTGKIIKDIIKTETVPEEEKNDYKPVNLEFDPSGKSVDDITGDDLISVLFSIRGNKAPLLEVKEFIKAGGQASTGLEMQFLAHAAWFHGNGGMNGWGVGSDPLVKAEVALDSSFDIPNLNEGSRIFNSDAFRTFQKAVENANDEIKSGLKMDLDRAKNFLTAITGVTTGGHKSRKSHKKTSKSRKSHKKTRKSRKSHKKTRKSRK
jgi:hypothetical protein